MPLKTVKISLDSALLKQAEKKLGERGTDLATYIRLHLRAMCRCKSVLHLGDTMPFGQYANEKVEDIVRAEPEYFAWLLKNSKNPSQFGEDILALLEELIELPKEQNAKETI